MFSESLWKPLASDFPGTKQYARNISTEKSSERGHILSKTSNRQKCFVKGSSDHRIQVSDRGRVSDKVSFADGRRQIVGGAFQCHREHDPALVGGVPRADRSRHCGASDFLAPDSWLLYV